MAAAHNNPMLYLRGMYKSQYTPEEAHEQLKLNEESSHHQARKDRVKRYIQARIVEVPELAEK
jgi:hypothetical protein